MPSSQTIDFGTSGLRGRAEAFSAAAVDAYISAFLDTVCEGAREKTVWIGVDLRASSPRIAGLVAASVAARGWTPRHAGAVPTPALARHTIAEGVPGIMVTGSHIPADHNGLKFYRPEGEVLKSDEAAIRAAAGMGDRERADIGAPVPASANPAVASAYRERYIGAFAPGSLAGLKVGLFEHSAVGRNIVAAVLGALGAHCIRFGRSDAFVAVDTEAVADEHIALMGEVQARFALDAVVSTDGDGDRPLVLDEAGRQINGDVLGALTARAIGAGTVVTPLTSTSAIEASNWFGTVQRTRIGSPYVIEAMERAPGETVAGFEANGGFLLGSPVRLSGGVLAPLATRDALLPILAVLAESVRQAAPLSALAASLPARVMKAGRIRSVPSAEGVRFVQDMARSRAMRAQFDARLADPLAIDTRDGTRLVLSGGAIVHFRQSGNAPELRCYVETACETDTQAMLDAMTRKLAGHFGMGER